MGVAALPPPSSPKLLNKVVQMDVQYTWILRKGLNCRQFRLLICWSFIGVFVQPVGEEGMEYSVILSRYKLHFVRVHDNLVQDPSNNKSIVENQRIKAINISNYV